MGMAAWMLFISPVHARVLNALEISKNVPGATAGLHTIEFQLWTRSAAGVKKFPGTNPAIWKAVRRVRVSGASKSFTARIPLGGYRLNTNQYRTGVWLFYRVRGTARIYKTRLSAVSSALNAQHAERADFAIRLGGKTLGQIIADPALKGPAGATGPAGIPGLAGPAGSRGLTGPVGPGDITGVTAGTGLTGGGATGAVTVNANTAYLQRRVTGVCGSGSAIRSVTGAGAVACTPGMLIGQQVGNRSGILPVGYTPIINGHTPVVNERIFVYARCTQDANAANVPFSFRVARKLGAALSVGSSFYTPGYTSAANVPIQQTNYDTFMLNAGSTYSIGVNVFSAIPTTGTRLDYCTVMVQFFSR